MLYLLSGLYTAASLRLDAGSNRQFWVQALLTYSETSSRYQYLRMTRRCDNPGYRGATPSRNSPKLVLLLGTSFWAYSLEVRSDSQKAS